MVLARLRRWCLRLRLVLARGKAALVLGAWCRGRREKTGVGDLAEGEVVSLGERLPFPVHPGNHGNVGEGEWRSGGVGEWRSGGVREWASGGVEEFCQRLDGPRCLGEAAVTMGHMTHTAVGPKSHGRGGVSYVYDDELHLQSRSCWSQNVFT